MHPGVRSGCERQRHTGSTGNPDEGRIAMRNIQIYGPQTWKKILSHPDATPDAIWFYLGPDYRFQRELSAKLGGRIREIPFGDDYHATVDAFRQDYVDHIAALYAAQRNSLDRFSGFLEKSPFISNVFQNACFIRLAVSILEHHPDSPAFIVCDDGIIARDLFLTLTNSGKNIVDATSLPPELSIGKKVAGTLTGLGRIALTGLGVLFRTRSGKRSSAHIRERLRTSSKIVLIHTWISRNTPVSGTYREEFFADLQEQLARRGYEPVLVPHIPYDLPFGKCLAALDQSGMPYVMEEHLMSFSSVIRIFCLCLGRRPYKGTCIIDGTVLSASVRNQGFRDWQGLQLLMPLAWEEIICTLSREQCRIRTFILQHENYSFEKAMIEGFRHDLPATTTTGYQHSTVTSNHISYCLARDRSDVSFLPDLIVTNGTYPRDLLIRNNYPSERLVVGGALRYAPHTGSPAASSEGEKFLLLTLPGVLDESVEMLEKVCAATGIGDIKVVVKAHPFVSLDRLRRSVQPEVLRRFEFSSKPVPALLPDASLLIYSASSTCIEALAFQVPVLRILSDRRLDIDPLREVRGRTPFIGVATHPDGIGTHARQLTGRVFSEEERAECTRIVHSLLGVVSGETYDAFTKTPEHPGNGTTK